MRKIQDLISNARANQLQYYRGPRHEVQKWFKSRDISIATDIWILDDYNGWEAIVGAWDRIWILKSKNGVIWIKDIQPVQGFKPNGMMIIS
jgi:hypothetical protein